MYVEIFKPFILMYNYAILCWFLILAIFYVSGKVEHMSWKTACHEKRYDLNCVGY